MTSKEQLMSVKVSIVLSLHKMLQIFPFSLCHRALQMVWCHTGMT